MEAAAVFPGDLRGWRGSLFAGGELLFERAPTVIEGGALVALETVRLALGHATALEGGEGNADVGHRKVGVKLILYIFTVVAQETFGGFPRRAGRTQ